MPEVEIAGVTNKLGMIRKTAHEYPLIFSGKFGQVRNKVILESSTLGHFEPYHKLDVIHQDLELFRILFTGFIPLFGMIMGKGKSFDKFSILK